MKRILLVGVAAGALVMSANLASAQTMERGGASGGASGEIKAGTPAGKASAQGQAQGDIKANTGGQGQMKAQDTQKNDSKGQRAQDNKAQDSKDQNAQSKSDSSKSGASAQGDTKSGSATTGQGAAGGAKASLTTEQRTRVRETVIRSSNAPRVSNVNFSLSVGTVVPRTVRFAPLPPLLVEYYPAWRSYSYFIVDEQIIIIEPSSFKIIAVISV